jgi:hypothetical protein
MFILFFYSVPFSGGLDKSFPWRRCRLKSLQGFRRIEVALAKLIPKCSLVKNAFNNLITSKLTRSERETFRRIVGNLNDLRDRDDPSGSYLSCLSIG